MEYSGEITDKFVVAVTSFMNLVELKLNKPFMKVVIDIRVGLSKKERKDLNKMLRLEGKATIRKEKPKVLPDKT